MTFNMFYIWRYYEAYHNDDYNIGKQLVQAQSEHFQNEGMGVQLNKAQVDRLLESFQNMGDNKDCESISFDNNTNMSDWMHEMYVLQKCQKGTCLCENLTSF